MAQVIPIQLKSRRCPSSVNGYLHPWKNGKARVVDGGDELDLRLANKSVFKCALFGSIALCVRVSGLSKQITTAVERWEISLNPRVGSWAARVDPCGWGIRYKDVVVHITFLYSLLRRTEILRISDLWALAMHRLGGEPQYLNGHGRLLIDQRARAQALISGVTEIDKKRKAVNSVVGN